MLLVPLSRDILLAVYTWLPRVVTPNLDCSEPAASPAALWHLFLAIHVAPFSHYLNVVEHKPAKLLHIQYYDFAMPVLSLLLRYVTRYPRGVFCTNRSALKRQWSYLCVCMDRAKIHQRIWGGQHRSEIFKGWRIVRATRSLHACLFLAHYCFCKSAVEVEGSKGCCPTRWRPIVRVAGAQLPQSLRVVLESWNTWVRQAGYWMHGRKERLTAKFFFNSQCGGPSTPASSIMPAASMHVPLMSWVDAISGSHDRPHV